MFIFLTAGILIAVGAAIGLFYYVFSIPEPEGISIAKWPQDFTDGFALWVNYENGELAVEEIGLARLDAYGLWIQFIDEAGQEIFSHNKPAGYPAKYSASELIAFGTGDYNGEYTVFTGSLDDSEKGCSYIIGFPYNIGKYILHACWDMDWCFRGILQRSQAGSEICLAVPMNRCRKRECSVKSTER